jgi:hypothetical protein
MASAPTAGLVEKETGRTACGVAHVLPPTAGQGHGWLCGAYGMQRASPPLPSPIHRRCRVVRSLAPCILDCSLQDVFRIPLKEQNRKYLFLIEHLARDPRAWDAQRL